MRQTPVNDYLEEISTELPEELYGHLSDAIYETVCEFDEEVAQLKAENAKLRKDAAETALMLGGAWRYCSKLRELVRDMWGWELHGCDACNLMETADCDTDIYSDDCLMRVALSDRMRELGVTS